MTQRFWISWVQPTSDYRPITYPPNNAIIGYWCSGSSSDMDEEDNDDTDAWILCALVQACNENEAKEAIYKDWPEATEWRFFEPKSNNWLPSDRFPLEDWMKERQPNQVLSNTLKQVKGDIETISEVIKQLEEEGVLERYLITNTPKPLRPAHF